MNCWLYDAKRILFNLINMDEFVYTMAVRHTILPWKTFAVLDPMSDGQQLDLSVSKPKRSSNSKGIARLFKGQGG